MQTSSLLWEIDDLLVYGEPSSDGEVARLAILCKCNVQVTAAGLPASERVGIFQQINRPAYLQSSKSCPYLLGIGGSSSPGMETLYMRAASYAA